MSFDRKYLVWSLAYAAIGIALGIYMAASHNHRELVAHAHILLLGFVVSFIYAIIHRLWLQLPGRRLAGVQFVLHQAAVALLSVGLFLYYGGYVEPASIDPVLALGALTVLVALLMMLYMVLKSRGAPAAS